MGEETGDDVAIDEVRRAVTQTREPIVRVTGVALAEMLGEDAERGVRALLDTPARGHALGWLMEQGLMSKEIDSEDDAGAMLAATLDLIALQCTGDPDDDRELQALFSTLFAQLPTDDLFDQLARTPDPWAGEILAAVDRLSHDKLVSKAARKALFRTAAWSLVPRAGGSPATEPFAFA